MDMTAAMAAITQAATPASGMRTIWGRWDGTFVYLDDAPDIALTATNAAGSLSTGQRVLCLQDARTLTILGPVALYPGPTAGGSGGDSGYWWRSGDGLQVCWVLTHQPRVAAEPYGPLFQGSWRWSFPVPFLYQPTVVCGGWQWGTGASWGTVIGLPTQTYATLRGIDAYRRTTADQVIVSAFAIGRWRS